MNQTTGVLKMHLRIKALWLIAPWSILLSSFIINLIIAEFESGKHGIYTGGIMSIYVYMLVAAIVLLNKTFPFALGLSMRRIDYFFGTGLLALIISAFTAIVLYALSRIEAATNGWGVRLHFFHLPYLNDGPAIAQLWIWFIAMLFVWSVGLLFSSVYRRFGGLGTFIFSFILFLLASAGSLLCTLMNWWGHIFRWIAYHSAVEFFSWFLPVVLCCAILTYLMMRRTTS